VKGSTWVRHLPAGKTPEELQKREEMILDAVEDGGVAPIDWIEIETSNEKHKGKFLVSADCVRIGDAEDSIRVATNAKTAQKIADELDCYLLTPKMLDLISRQAMIKIPPSTQTSWADGTMAETRRMVEHHEAVEELVDGRAGLIDNVGKIWAITAKILKKIGLAANYGWFVTSGGLRSATGLRVIQSVGYRHGTDHVDYSQTVRLVKREMVVDDFIVDVANALQHPEMASLVSHEGMLVGSKYPTVDEDGDTDPRITLPEITITPSPGWWDDPTHWRPVLEQGDAGADVAGWQRVVLKDGHDLGPAVDDGDFQGQTHNATIAWQAARGLVKDGVVGPNTRAKIGTKPIPKRVVPLSGEVDNRDAVVNAEIPARNWSKHRGVHNPKDLIVIHSMEAKEASTTAENVSKWAAGNNAPNASWQYAVDDDSVVRCVPEGGIAWHAPGANRNGIGIEHAGYARQSETQWNDVFSTNMLRRSARLSAEICKRHGIPVEFVDRKGLRDGKRGFTTHNEVTFAFRKSTHVDPGKHFPMDQYLTWVREAMADGS
jgi:peptidoglycan hydrolase-like protein with peptidoglycan-binding domain